ncbi:hypothetical protein O6H91_17G003800 [Diphasiastrum complanatum]|uniref:Uncharacterized protein n=1 Tax=Diphasiastrum complanatum TaxID=34168 RepID=A0ACC2B3V7_DIPCM|nr:hypothetical protein O6H91_17G003800 [Diphasiastrum complanatum]
MATPKTEETVLAAAPAEVPAEKPPTQEDSAVVVEESTDAPAVAVVEAGGEEVVGNSNVGDAPDTSLVEPDLPPFKEETYFVADLKESEKKALQEFKQKVEEGIRSNAFAPPKAEVVAKDSEPEKASELVAAAEAKEEGSKEKATEKTEEAAAETSPATEVSTESHAEPALPLSEDVVIGTETETDSAGTKSVEVAETVIEEVITPAAAVSDHDTTPTDTEAAPPALDSAPASDAPSKEAVVTEAVTIEAAAETQEVTPDFIVDEDLSLWGVPLLHSKGDPRTDVILLKFLRARDSKVNNSFSMLKNTILWRKKFGADSILEEDFGTDFDGVAYLHGVDKEGHPVSYNVFGALNDKDLYQKAFGDQTKIEKFIRWRVQLLEKSIQLLNFSPGGANALIHVIDLKNSPSPLKKEIRIFVYHALALLQDNYPELVVKTVVINVPPWYCVLYSMIVSPFLTQRTKSKFILVPARKVPKSLFKLISPEQVPVQYGGLSRLNDEDFGDAEAPVTDIAVKAGEKQTVEFEVTAAGGTILWELAVVGWDISYGAEFVPNAQGGYTTIIEKTKKITSSKEPVPGQGAWRINRANCLSCFKTSSYVLLRDAESIRSFQVWPAFCQEFCGQLHWSWARSNIF